MTYSGENAYFSFAVPPESEDFDFGQRVTETKTLSGSVFDDYGNDTIGIQISGTTINEEKKLIYQGQNGMFIPNYLSGEKEIFALQKLISDWGKGDKIPSKRIYLYDLSKMSLLQLVTDTICVNLRRIKNTKLRYPLAFRVSAKIRQAGEVFFQT
ncbi:MAG: surface-adhesin E family protein, partial [Treponema sp.]|nr:surface-adhesin E family protein [Treponema sp.]